MKLTLKIAAGVFLWIMAAVACRAQTTAPPSTGRTASPTAKRSPALTMTKQFRKTARLAIETFQVVVDDKAQGRVAANERAKSLLGQAQVDADSKGDKAAYAALVQLSSLSHASLQAEGRYSELERHLAITAQWHLVSCAEHNAKVGVESALEAAEAAMGREVKHEPVPPEPCPPADAQKMIRDDEARGYRELAASWAAAYAAVCAEPCPSPSENPYEVWLDSQGRAQQCAAYLYQMMGEDKYTGLGRCESKQ